MVDTRASSPGETQPRLAAMRDTFSLLRHDPAAAASLLFLLLLGLGILIGPVLYGDSSLDMSMEQRLMPPSVRSGHVLGTDALGRDLLGRILLGARVSLGIAVVVVVVDLLFGVALGVIAGYLGGPVDDALMRFVDLAMGFPSLLLALVVIFALGPSVRNMTLVLLATNWMQYSRVARAETLRIRHFAYVDASRAIGGNDFWIVCKHVLPNLVSVIFTVAALSVATVILAESGLSFLGLGVQPPDASLGLIVAQGRRYISTAGWVMLYPGLTIFAITTAFTLLANWVGIAMDPVQRWRLTSARRR